MIHANEIRIGNLVNSAKKRHDEKFIEIESVNYEKINVEFREYNLYDLQPIPLTEEWLLKFGFKYDCDLVNSLVLYGIWFNKKNMEATYLSQKLIKIKYVHQLQNIFFALTGEELTLKP